MFMPVSFEMADSLGNVCASLVLEMRPATKSEIARVQVQVRKRNNEVNSEADFRRVYAEEISKFCVESWNLDKEYSPSLLGDFMAGSPLFFDAFIGAANAGKSFAKAKKTGSFVEVATFKGVKNG